MDRSLTWSCEFGEKRYEPENDELAARGISERQPLDLHSPYGCSKGVADQYVLDYARTFSLPAVVFRISCIYGPHQHGNEDQGWVAHFLMRACAIRRLRFRRSAKRGSATEDGSRISARPTSSRDSR